MTYVRHTALHGALARLKPVWGTLHGMRIPMQFRGAVDTREALDRLAIADVSFLDKLGVKGPGAAGWLLGHGVQPPETAFEVAPLAGNGGIVARIGRSEFFLESGVDEAASLPIVSSIESPPTPTAHPMPRHDVSLLVAGARVPDLLAQTCGVNLMDEAPNRIVLTRFAAVSVMLLYRPDPMRLRIWCDPSFGVYLWNAVLEIARDLGGALAGVDGVRPLLT